ncbi:hypothetical protein LCGC14_3108000 [marine sediment metagenome]|uniref:Uncharacterized protein n=1 Tax=marine sediment metagenome TaxID=412755 RepID=A0A0F8W6A0_9ZZZZ
MSDKKYLKRVGFKLSIKDKWLYTYWIYSNMSELPYDLKNYIEHLVEMFNEDEIYIKIQRKKNE